jgi:hypothetical protein
MVTLIVLFGIAWFGVPVGYLLYLGKKRMLVVVNSLLFMFISFCLLYLPIEALPYVESDVDFELIALGAIILFFPICWMAVMLFAPLQQLTRRLSFVVLGVLTLVVLSEISKLNLRQYLRPTKIGTVRMQTQSPGILSGRREQRFATAPRVDELWQRPCRPRIATLESTPKK